MTFPTPIAARLCGLAAIALSTGCATAPERPRGAVVPMEGGRYQSVVKSSDPQAALKTFTRDAEITCTKTPTTTRMPWEAKPAPAKYAVLSQSVKTKEGREISSTDNKMADAGIQLAMRRYGMEAKDEVQATTVFKCE